MSGSHQFRLVIATDNAAFEDDAPGEVARILRALADRIEREPRYLGAYQDVRDINGNKVGQFALKARELFSTHGG